MEQQNRKSCLVIGGRGFVGSALVAKASVREWQVTVVGRRDYDQYVGQRFDLVVGANGNASRFRANREPAFDLEASVLSVQRSLVDFQFQQYALISSVDVYSNPTCAESTREDAEIDLRSLCHYGFHKRLAELLVMRQAACWHIFRLAQMVGPGLKKGPTYDLLNGRPLWIDPDSRLHYMHTQNVARVVFDLVENAPRNQIYNVCGRGSVALRDVIAMLPQDLQKVTFAGSEHQEYHVNTDRAHQLCRLPESSDEIREFLSQQIDSAGALTE